MLPFAPVGPGVSWVAHCPLEKPDVRSAFVLFCIGYIQIFAFSDDDGDGPWSLYRIVAVSRSSLSCLL